MVHPEIRGTVLFRELANNYRYGGSYVSLIRQLRQLRPLEMRDPEIRFETDPGVETQGDWAQLGLYLVEGTMWVAPSGHGLRVTGGRPEVVGRTTARISQLSAPEDDEQVPHATEVTE